MNETVMVAHRGLSALYPENTLIAIEKALDAGARAVEFDLQLTADRVPVLFHDPTLDRMTGESGLIMQETWRGLRRRGAAYPGRFGNAFTGTPIASLAGVMELLDAFPGVTPCLEIKSESVEYFGLKACVEAVLRAAAARLGEAIAISFRREVIACLHAEGIDSTAWVLERYDRAALDSAAALAPRCLVCSIQRLPQDASRLEAGPWQWMVYHTESPGVIREYIDRGARYIETDNIRAVAAAMPELFRNG